MRLEKVRRLLAVGDNSNLDGLILISASALFHVVGDEGLATPARSILTGGGGNDSLLPEACAVANKRKRR